ncbi:HD domain-containing protein, partial [bacterium]|nr:HD domain-containing protein [bacterium]
MKTTSLINEFLVKIGEISDRAGMEVYAVGGFVRDKVLGKAAREIDFVVIGDGVKFAKKAGNTLNASGFTAFKRFGTASFLYEGMKLEFVTARKETYQKNSRKPVVEKSDLESDLSRRDFTINTLAVGVNKNNFGKIIDIFEGRKDLKKKLIRTPMDPNQTFSDDPLRIMRAARFASQLGFRIERDTLKAMKNQKDRLAIVSQERITGEFLKILSHTEPSIGLWILLQTGVLEIIFPELAALRGVEQRDDFHHKDVFEHTMKVVDNLSGITDNLLLRFTALVHDIGKPRVKQFVQGSGWTFHGHELVGVRMLQTICRNMKLPNNYLKLSKKLTSLHMRPIQLTSEEVTDSAIRRLLVQAGDE